MVPNCLELFKFKLTKKHQATDTPRRSSNLNYDIKIELSDQAIPFLNQLNHSKVIINQTYLITSLRKKKLPILNTNTILLNLNFLICLYIRKRNKIYNCILL